MIQSNEPLPKIVWHIVFSYTDQENWEEFSFINKNFNKIIEELWLKILPNLEKIKFSFIYPPQTPAVFQTPKTVKQIKVLYWSLKTSVCNSFEIKLKRHFNPLINTYFNTNHTTKTIDVLKDCLVVNPCVPISEDFLQRAILNCDHIAMAILLKVAANFNSDVLNRQLLHAVAWLTNQAKFAPGGAGRDTLLPDRTHCIQLLVEHKADVNATIEGPGYQTTALMQAVWITHLPHVATLLNLGADVEIKVNNENAIDCADVVKAVTLFSPLDAQLKQLLWEARNRQQRTKEL